MAYEYLTLTLALDIIWLKAICLAIIAIPRPEYVLWILKASLYAKSLNKQGILSSGLFYRICCSIGIMPDCLYIY
jgi:hypothetical protein